MYLLSPVLISQVVSLVKKENILLWKTFMKILNNNYQT